jgi:soluble lytic murein transglycosylase-like protein
MKPVILAVMITIITGGNAMAQIDMAKIAMIESSNNPKAVGKGDDIGLYQITPILLEEYNQRTKSAITKAELFDPAVNTKIATWYISKRIPQLLKHYGIPITTEAIIVCWNAGINTLVKNKPIPDVTRRFLEKYNGTKKQEKSKKNI